GIRDFHVTGVQTCALPIYQTLVNALLHHCGPAMAAVGDPARPGIVHRLDKDTSGILVAAKTVATHAGLAAQFAAHSVERAYKAGDRKSVEQGGGASLGVCS